MAKVKKAYKKPELRSVSMLEVGAATCCRTGSCNKTNRISRGKGSNNNMVS